MSPKKQLKRGQDDLMREQGYMPVVAVAKQCGVTRASVELWVKNGHIQFTRVGLRVYIDRASLVKFLGVQGSKLLEPAV